MKLRSQMGGSGGSGDKDNGRGEKDRSEYGKEIKCPNFTTCVKTFNDRYNLNRHLMICGKHEPYMYKCHSEAKPDCTFSSKYYRSYEKHMNNIYGEVPTLKYQKPTPFQRPSPQLSTSLKVLLSRMWV